MNNIFLSSKPNRKTMKKSRKRLSFISAIAVAIAAFTGGATQVNATPQTDAAQTTQSQTKQEGQVTKTLPVQISAKRNRNGGFSGERMQIKHYRKDGRNQRQWRKWLRANPSMRKSKHGKKKGK
jgi:hypothetical protein